MTVVMILGWFNLYHGTAGGPIWGLILSCTLFFYNGQYYARQAIESSALFDMRARLDAAAPEGETRKTA
jgi:hypothetical protein